MTLLAGNMSGFDISSDSGNPGSVTINNVISGDSTAILCAENDGQLYLNGINTYSGGTWLGFSGQSFTGIINFNNSASFGTNGILIINTGGVNAALAVEGTSAVTIPNTVSWATSGGAYSGVNIVGNPAGVTFSGNWYLTNTASIGSGGAANNLVTISGAIASVGGAYGLNLFNPGILALSGVNTYTGATAVNAGTLALGPGGAIGASTVTVASGATLASTAVNPVTIGGPTTLSSGASASFTGAGGLSSTIGQISVTGNLTLNANAITVNVTGAPLKNGTYRLMSCGGSLANIGTFGTPTITGAGVNGTASISVTIGSAGHLDLAVGGGTAAGVTTSPSSESVCAGSSTSFTVVGSGSTPLSYAWRKQGSGWGGSWTITDTPSSGYAGHLIGNPGSVGTSDIGTACWQQYANGSGTPQDVAYRNFPATGSPLTTGQSFVIDLQNPGNAKNNTTGKIGFGLTDLSNNPYLEFQYIENQTDWTIHDSASASTDTGVAHDGRGIHVIVTLTSATTYSCTIEKYNSGGSGFSSTTITNGTLLSGGSGGIQRLCFWNINGGTSSDIYFNNLVVGPGADDNGGNYSGTWTSGATDTFGEAPLASGGEFSGINTATLTINLTSVGDTGSYSCLVYNANGYSTCTPAGLTVNTESAAPTSATASLTTICSGGSTTLTLNGGGGGNNETVHWYTGSCGGASVRAGNGLSVSPTTTTTYYGRYEDGAPCSYNSACASVTVTVDPGPTGPTVSIAPGSTICAGNPATFSVSTASGSPSGYAWRKRNTSAGWGTGNNWVFTCNSTACDNWNGVFIGSATTSGQSPGINDSGQAFGLYANTSNSAEAKRSFGNLSVGQNISFDVQIPKTLTGSSGGNSSQALFALRNSANEANPRFEMWVLAGASYVTISDGTGNDSSTVPYDSNGYQCVFKLTGQNTYNLTVTLLDGSSGPYTYTGRSLKGTSNDPVNQVRAWLKNYDTGGGSAEDFFINNIVAGAYEDNASNYTAGGCASTSWTTSPNLGFGPVASSASYVISSPATTDSGSYDVLVWDFCGQALASPVTLTVNKASTTNNVAASPNPSLPGASVTFTATLTAVAPGAGTPTGTVLFKTNGVALCDPVALDTISMATLITHSLPHGSNTVSAEYAGDSNFQGSTNSVVQVVNTPPIAPNTTAEVTENQTLVFSGVKLLSLCHDPDGDPLPITSAGPISTNNAAESLGNNVSLDNFAGTITYAPAANFVGTDLFSFVVSDAYGASSTGTVLVIVTSASVPSPNIVVPAAYANGTFSVTFAGIPGCTYTVQWAPTVAGAWSFLKTATSGADGLFTVTDTPVPPPTSRYYRTVYP
jgi:autotransporter-associated beta strand protein